MFRMRTRRLLLIAALLLFTVAARTAPFSRRPATIRALARSSPPTFMLRPSDTRFKIHIVQTANVRVESKLEKKHA